jgi:hypothetical protein
LAGTIAQRRPLGKLPPKALGAVDVAFRSTFVNLFSRLGFALRSDSQ